jgi:hypothetical protein
MSAGKGSARVSRPDYRQKTQYLMDLVQVLWATSNSPGKSSDFMVCAPAGAMGN